MELGGVGTVPDPVPGRLGLALSGGGFRASFFHVGVLARMADLGLLREVEVISTVSGGSIIGALYYLHVKRLLEVKTDEELRDADYRALVARIEREFLRAVQRNLIARTFLDPVKNVRMSRADYSRSDRIGEIYDEFLYRPVVKPGRSSPVEMRELKIQPAGGPPAFHPESHNGSRRHKVPILLINATTLNTGHNWRFEAVRMGEPPRSDPAAVEIDQNLRLQRPPSYAAILEKQQNIELGLAVAASAGVPGIFPPLAISDLYPEGIRVQLVDGGVHDNQGVQGLLECRCARLVVSDASGQMGDEPAPATGATAVAARANSILMDRVREEELLALAASGRSVALTHLRQGLCARAVPWVGPGGEVTPGPRDEPRPAVPPPVDPRVQDRLSRVRTHLDSFTDVEAFSLMLDGYLLAGPRLAAVEGKSPGEAPDGGGESRWRFLEMAPWLRAPTAAYLHQLDVAGQLALKVFRLSWPVTALTGLAGVALVGLLWAWLGRGVSDLLGRSVTVGSLLATALVLALGFVPRLSRAFRILERLREPSEFAVRWVRQVALCLLAAAGMWVHLQVFDRLFLRLGRVERLVPPRRP